MTDAEFATALRTLRDWQSIANFHTKHSPPCPDDGMYAEGYSDLVVRTLARSWSRLPELSRISGQRPAFKNFVLKHIDASADPSELKLIVRRAASACPRGEDALCMAVGTAAKAALAEL